jgi:hypothetical protein
MFRGGGDDGGDAAIQALPPSFPKAILSLRKCRMRP